MTTKNTYKVQNIQVVVKIIVLFLWLLLWILTHQSRSMSSSKTNRPAVIATAMTQISTFFDPGFRRSVFTVVIICSDENRQKVTCHTTAWSVILKSLLNWHSTKPCVHFCFVFLFCFVFWQNCLWQTGVAILQEKTEKCLQTYYWIGLHYLSSDYITQGCRCYNCKLIIAYPNQFKISLSLSLSLSLHRCLLLMIS